MLDDLPEMNTVPAICDLCRRPGTPCHTGTVYCAAHAPGQMVPIEVLSTLTDDQVSRFCAALERRPRTAGPGVARHQTGAGGSCPPRGGEGGYHSYSAAAAVPGAAHAHQCPLCGGYWPHRSADAGQWQRAWQVDCGIARQMIGECCIAHANGHRAPDPDQAGGAGDRTSTRRTRVLSPR